MRGLAGEPLVRGGKLGAQLGDGRGLLVGVRLGRAEPRLQPDAAVLQPSALAVLLLEGGERRLSRAISPAWSSVRALSALTSRSKRRAGVAGAAASARRVDRRLRL